MGRSSSGRPLEGAFESRFPGEYGWTEEDLRLPVLGVRPWRSPPNCLLRAHRHSELAAATPATASQSLATRSSLHPGSEAVLVQTLPISWPICRLHPCSPRSERPSARRCEAGKGIRILKVESRRKRREKSRLTFPHPAPRIPSPGHPRGTLENTSPALFAAVVWSSPRPSSGHRSSPP